VSVQHQPALMMALRTGSIEVGSRRPEMMRSTFGAGEMCLVPRHVETWLRTDDLHYLYLSVDISDAALAAACDGTRGDVELRRVGKLVDARVGALATAVNALDSVVAGIPTFGPVVSWLLRGISNLGNGLHILEERPAFIH
jgi:hypothetical protein